MKQITTTTTAAEIAAVCTTAAAAKSYYKDLIAAGLERIQAKEITDAAAAIVKQRNEDAAAAAKEVREEIRTAKTWYRDGSKVMHAVFVAFVRSADFKNATKGIQFNGNEIAFIERYFPVIYNDNRPVKIVREYVNGVLFKRYRFVNTDRAGAYQSIFDACLDSIKKIRIGEFTQVRIQKK